MSRVDVEAVLQNTKGKEFTVRGTYSGDGRIKLSNPRPARYEFEFLYTDPDVYNDDDPKRLFWVVGKKLGDLSPFRIKSIMFAKPKRLVKTTRTRSK